MPIAVSEPSSVTAKQAYVPACRCRSVHAMKRSKPSTVVGGGEMNRETSSVVSIAKSDGASDARSSRSVTPLPLSTGKPSRQSVLTGWPDEGSRSPRLAWMLIGVVSRFVW